jgi:hypothetical protein
LRISKNNLSIIDEKARKESRSRNQYLILSALNNSADFKNLNNQSNEEEHELLKILIKIFIENEIEADIPSKYNSLIKQLSEELEE